MPELPNLASHTKGRDLKATLARVTIWTQPRRARGAQDVRRTQARAPRAGPRVSAAYGDAWECQIAPSHLYFPIHSAPAALHSDW